MTQSVMLEVVTLNVPFGTWVRIPVARQFPGKAETEIPVFPEEAKKLGTPTNEFNTSRLRANVRN